jgi:hypothetical protein
MDMSGQIHVPAALPSPHPGKNSRANSREGWLGPRCSLTFSGEEKNILSIKVLNLLSF